MATYKLSFGFYIEMDALNYTLRRKYMGKSRDGQEKEAVKICGYFGNLESAVKEYLRLVQLENLKDETFSSDEFLNAIEKSNEAAVEEILKKIDGSDRKQSNGDRICGMSDKELAHFISVQFCHGYVEPQILEWLKQPMED